MRTTTFLLFGCITLVVVVAISRQNGAYSDREQVGQTAAQIASARPLSTEDGATLNEHSAKRRGRLSPVPDENRRFRAKPKQDVHKMPVPGFIILDESEPEERVDIGESRDVESTIDEPAGVQQFIGPPLDADDPLAWSAQQSYEAEVETGDLLDADAPDGLLLTHTSDMFPESIGDTRDADPLADALWQTDDRADTPVRDIGRPLTVTDETTGSQARKF